MFRSQQLKSIEFELANKCNARCPQCPRYSQGKLIKGLNKDEITLDDITKSISIDMIKKLTSVIFKGTTGDPIIAKDFIPILKYFKQHNADMEVWIATNGGLHDTNYWTNLANILNSNDKIVFGIDGLEDTHSIYRVGTDYNKVIENATAFIRSGGNAHWQFIKFSHNEHQWQDCKELSKTLGFTNFVTLHSDRNFEESHLNPPSDQIKLEPTGCVSCMSANKKEVFVYADGTVYPCCYLGGMHTWSADTDTSLDYSMLKKITNPLEKTLHTDSLDSIIDSDQFQKFAEVFENPLRPCKKYCSY